MNKMKKVIAFAACATMVATLSGCTSSSAKYTKVGFGMTITPGDKTSTTTATVALDSKGKVAFIDIDAFQTPNKKDETKTKKELQADYAMKDASAIKKEWFEQAEEFEKWATGKTLEEIAEVETMDYHGGKAANTGTDLAAGCTIVLDDILAAIEEAGKNMTEVKADKVGAGEISSYNEEKGQKNTTTAAVALDSKGKVVWSFVDVSQNPNGNDETKSKKELQADYGMKDASAIKKEWFEQAEEFEKWANGKTADEIAGVETMDFHGGKAAKTGTDLAAGCTIVIDDFLGAYAEAIANAK